MNELTRIDPTGSTEVAAPTATQGPLDPDRRSVLKAAVGAAGGAAASTFGRGVGLLGTGAVAYGGYKTYEAITAPREVHVAMMRLDNQLIKNPDGGTTQSTQTALCLDHRAATEKDPENKTAHDTVQQIDVSVNANSLKPEGHEVLVLSPELSMRANDPDASQSKTNIAGHNITIANTAQDVFIPFQLLENAQSATFGYNAAGKLTLTIKSLPVEIPPSVEEQLSDATNAAQRAAACAAERASNGLRAYIPDAISGILPESIVTPNDEAHCTPLAPREKRYATATSTITLEGATRTNLPNIHFYDTRRYHADYHLAGDYRIEADNLHKRIIQGHGDLLESNLTGKTNPEMIALAPTRSFKETKLQRDFEATRLGVSSEYSNSLVEQLAGFTKDWDFNPEGLDTAQRHALNMAVDYKQREFDGKPWTEQMIIRGREALGITQPQR